jgi:hypothetical protein
MTTCPACNCDNLYGALLCHNCSTLLERPIDLSADTTLASTALVHGSNDSVPMLSPEASNRLATQEIKLIFDVSVCMVIQVPSPVILGRRSLNTTSQPQIDLTPYGGFERGISRLHAVIKPHSTGFIIEDLDSSNGTWLNHTRLQPYVPNPLQFGALVKLGTLEFRVHFRQSVHK